jgi:exopolysaccharide biosynthesis polyprenyl glycosylphosphotransferase
MMNMRKKLLAKGTRVLDIIIMALTFFVSLYFHAPEQAPQNLVEFLSVKITLINVVALFVLAIGWNRLFAYFGLYEVRRLGSVFREWFDIVKAVTVSVMFLAAISLLLSRKNIQKEVLITFWISCVVITILSRLLVREYLIFLRNHGRNLRYIVFVGSSTRALDLAQKVLSRQDLGYRLLGFVDDDFTTVNKMIPKAKRLCNLAQFPDYLENHVVDEVFIALPIKSYYDKIRNIIYLCSDLGILCRVPSNWFEFRTANTSAYELQGIPILTVFTGSKHQLEYLWLKRLIDITISLVALLLLVPLLVLISALIKLTSHGPVLFAQERIGYNKRKFKILKFRTMVDHAEAMQAQLEHLNEADGPTFKIRQDPRITWIGHWLRKTSMDEIPQLLNVLKGEMSLVGPRPLPIRDVEGIDERWQKRRFSMRPGLTCLWQINGRNKIKFIDWMKLDLEYIDKWTIKLDFLIIAKTIPTIFKATGQ